MVEQEKLTAEWQEETLYRLMASKQIVESTKGPLWLEYPSIDDKMIAKYYYSDFVSKNRNKIPDIQNAMLEHKKAGVWSDDKEKQILKLPDFIEETELKIKEIKQPSRLKQLQDWRRKLERAYLQLISAKNTIFSNTLEYLANNRASSYLIYKSFKTLDNNVLWKSFNDLENDDPDFINELIQLLVQYTSPLNERELRTLARNSIWRIRWSTCKRTPFELFHRHLPSISQDQFLLIYWSQIYDMAYESMDRPPDHVIDDDVKFDTWLEEQIKKNKSKTEQQYYGKNSKLKDRAGEVMTMVNGYYDKEGFWHNYTPEEKQAEVDRIRKMNSPIAKSILAREENVLRQNAGRLLQEGELRKDIKTIELMGGTVKKGK